jgi:hypothetical protein
LFAQSEAVEGACAFLMCCCQDYQKSENCKLEAKCVHASVCGCARACVCVCACLCACE